MISAGFPKRKNVAGDLLYLTGQAGLVGLLTTLGGYEALQAVSEMPHVASAESATLAVTHLGLAGLLAGATYNEYFGSSNYNLRE